MGCVSASSQRPERTARTWRVRAGITRTFGSLFVVLCILLVSLGAMLLYDAYAYPLTAQSGQVLVGAVSLAMALLLLAFLWRQGR
jgi:hypothetical protein